MSEEKIVSEIIANIEEYESEASDFYGLWNEWANHYRMVDTRKDPRPNGISRSLTAETPRAVHALSSSLTRMQTSADPFFELRSRDGLNREDVLFEMEKRYKMQLEDFQFKRNLEKGNKGMCLFGTQVWEEPYMQVPSRGMRPLTSGTAFNPVSLLQVAFRAGCYSIDHSDFFAVKYKMNPNFLRFIARGTKGVWDFAKIEEGIKQQSDAGAGNSESAIQARRRAAKYADSKSQPEIILYHGRLDPENPWLQQKWEEWGMSGKDLSQCDITIGILNRKHIIRSHPTAYGTWHHLYKIGHYQEFELEPFGRGVGAMGSVLQKDMNRILSRVNDTEIFSLFNMFLVGGNADLTGTNLNIFPYGMIPVRDVNQVKELRPQIEGIINGIKLLEFTRDDFRGVTNATDTLQAITTGATATESSLAQGQAMRALSIIAEIENESVVKPHLYTMHRNEVDQNPFDSNLIREIEFEVKATTDKDYRPEHSQLLLKLYTILTSVRSNTPIDYDPSIPVLKYLFRSAGMNPRELNEKRSQVDKMLEMMRRVNGSGEMKNQIAGELAGAGKPDGNIEDIPAAIPSPVSSMEG